MKGTLNIFFKGSDLIIKPSKEFIKFGSIRNILFWDKKENFFRTFPFYYNEIIQFSKDNEIELIDEIDRDRSLSFSINEKLNLRPYQNKAIDLWRFNEESGIILMGTGGGKTYLGLEAIKSTKQRTLIIVPTIDLMKQWEEKISTLLKIPPKFIGKFGGGEQTIRDITISTYSSANLYVLKFRNYFGLVIYDEVHHLFAPNYRSIAKGLVARSRLGLTATLENDLIILKENRELVGPVVFTINQRELQKKKYVSDYKIERIFVDFSPEEKRKYDELRKSYRAALIKYKIQMRSGSDFQRLILLSGRDPLVRKAVLSHQKARRLAFHNKNKVRKIEDLLVKHKNDKLILFSEYTNTVKELQRVFLLPSLTSETPKEEREKILTLFRKNKITKIATSRVLDEGIDIHDVNIGIIISGSSVKRQTVQRLGRLLRKKQKPAILYELITRDTSETFAVRRRDPDKTNL
ncbi:MAG: DEAD/DEAH box helicase [Candidatus Ranarchaeia archaeon]